MSGYTKASNTFFKRPEGGTKQDNLTKENIKELLKGYKRIKTEDLKNIRIGTYVRYYNMNEKKLRYGGILIKVIDPKYIVLKNSNKMLTWSVQFENNFFFIKEDIACHEEQTEKNRLYELYKEGKLTLKK